MPTTLHTPEDQHEFEKKIRTSIKNDNDVQEKILQELQRTSPNMEHPFSRLFDDIPEDQKEAGRQILLSFLQKKKKMLYDMVEADTTKTRDEKDALLMKLEQMFADTTKKPVYEDDETRTVSETDKRAIEQAYKRYALEVKAVFEKIRTYAGGNDNAATLTYIKTLMSSFQPDLPFNKNSGLSDLVTTLQNQGMTDGMIINLFEYHIYAEQKSYVDEQRRLHDIAQIALNNVKRKIEDLRNAIQNYNATRGIISFTGKNSAAIRSMDPAIISLEQQLQTLVAEQQEYAGRMKDYMTAMEQYNLAFNRHQYEIELNAMQDTITNLTSQVIQFRNEYNQYVADLAAYEQVESALEQIDNDHRQVQQELQAIHQENEDMNDTLIIAFRDINPSIDSATRQTLHPSTPTEGRYIDEIDERSHAAQVVLTRLEALVGKPFPKIGNQVSSITRKVDKLITVDIATVKSTLHRLSSSPFIDPTALSEAITKLDNLNRSLEEYKRKLGDELVKPLSDREAEYNKLQKLLPSRIQEFKEFIQYLTDLKQEEEEAKKAIALGVNQRDARLKQPSIGKRHTLFELTPSRTNSNELVINKSRGPIEVTRNWETSLEADLYILQTIGMSLYPDWKTRPQSEKAKFVRNLYKLLIDKIEDDKVVLKDPPTTGPAKTLYDRITNISLKPYVSKKQLRGELVACKERGGLTSDEVMELYKKIQYKRTDQTKILIDELRALVRQKYIRHQTSEAEEVENTIENLETMEMESKKLTNPRDVIALLVKALIIMKERQRLNPPDIPDDIEPPVGPEVPEDDTVIPEPTNRPQEPRVPGGVRPPREPEEPPPPPEEPVLDLKDKVLSEQGKEDEDGRQQPEGEKEKVVVSDIEQMINEEATKRAEERLREWYATLPKWRKGPTGLLMRQRQRKKFYEEERARLRNEHRTGAGADVVRIQEEGGSHAHRQNLNETEAIQPLTPEIVDARLNNLARDFVLGTIGEPQVRTEFNTIWQDMVTNNPALNLNEVEYYAEDFLIILRTERARKLLQDDMRDAILNSPDIAAFNARRRALIQAFRVTNSQDPEFTALVEDNDLTPAQLILLRNHLAAVDWLKLKRFNYVVRASKKGARAAFSIDNKDRESTFSRAGSWLGKHPWLRALLFIGPPTAVSLLVPPVAPGVLGGALPSAVGAGLAGTFAGSVRSTDGVENAGDQEVGTALGEMDPTTKRTALEATPVPTWKHPGQRIGRALAIRRAKKEEKLATVIHPMEELTPRVDSINQLAARYHELTPAQIADLRDQTTQLLVLIDTWRDLRHDFAKTDQGVEQRERAWTQGYKVLTFALAKLGQTEEQIRALPEYQNHRNTVQNIFNQYLARFKRFRTKEALTIGAITGAVYFGSAMLIRTLVNAIPHTTTTVTPSQTVDTYNFKADTLLPDLKARLLTDHVDISKPDTAIQNLIAWLHHHSADYSFVQSGNSIQVFRVVDLLQVDPGIRDQLLATLGQQKFDAFIHNLVTNDPATRTLWETLVKDVFHNQGLGNDAKNQILRFIFDATQGNPALPEITTLAQSNGFNFSHGTLQHSANHLNGLVLHQAQWIFPNELALQQTQNFINLVNSHAAPQAIQTAFEQLPQRVQAEVLMDFIQRTGTGTNGMNALTDLIMDRVTQTPAGALEVSLTQSTIPGETVTKTVWGTLKKMIGLPTFKNWFLTPSRARQQNP